MPPTGSRSGELVQAYPRSSELAIDRMRQNLVWVEAVCQSDSVQRIFQNECWQPTSSKLLDSSSMSTFILVHGAWQSIGTWDRLSPLLQKLGHKVITPILRGLGTDQDRLTADITLHQHIDDVATELASLPDAAVLVGHSYAGMVISGAAEAHPDKVKRLAYLDAFIPEDGQCALDLLPPDIGAYFRNVAREHGDGWRLPGGESQLDLWGLKPGEARDFVRERLCDFSLRCFEGPVRLGAKRKSKIPTVFVSCVAAEYPARPFFEPFAKKARASDWQVCELDTGHDCHVERPGEVANILVSDASF
jgi:pimeloyl-ACP methyl ester carboxylesterase